MERLAPRGRIPIARNQYALRIVVYALPAGLEHVRHVGKRVLELTAKRIQHRDDGDRDASGNQAVFDRGRAPLVAKKISTSGTLLHGFFPSIARPRRPMAPFAVP